MTKFSLVADVGGTNTRIALSQNGELLDGSIKKLANDAYDELTQLISSYLKLEGVATCVSAVVAIAGPVRDNEGWLTNRAWHLDAMSLGQATGAQSATIVNDLQAQGYALDHIDDAHLVPIYAGSQAKPQATRLVIGVGTGFNCAPVYTTSTDVFTPPSEAGHTSLPYDAQASGSMAQWLQKTGRPAVVEEVLSGRGLAHCYAWASQSEGGTTSAEVLSLAEAEDPIALKALDIFVGTLASTSRSLALTYLPYGGIYLAGGMARAVSPWLHTFGFSDTFVNQTRLADILTQIPISLVEDDFAALRGCAHLAAARTCPPN